MTMRIVDNKKIDMTDSEWEMYKSICESYNTISNRGEDYFIDLFETNDDGIIVFLRPPSKRQTSLEIFLFLVSLMNHQHIRLMHNEVYSIAAQMQEKIKEIDTKLQQLSKKKGTQ